MTTPTRPPQNLERFWLESEVCCLPGNDVPRNEDGTQERADVDVPRAAEEVSGDQGHDCHQGNELVRYDG